MFSILVMLDAAGKNWCKQNQLSRVMRGLSGFMVWVCEKGQAILHYPRCYAKTGTAWTIQNAMTIVFLEILWQQNFCTAKSLAIAYRGWCCISECGCLTGYRGHLRQKASYPFQFVRYNFGYGWLSTSMGDIPYSQLAMIGFTAVDSIAWWY